jgi:PEP-CTERM/exosortase A-associated glycosyltransferase
MARRLTEVIRHVRPEVIHAHSPALNGEAALRAGRSAGLPVVYEVRAFWEDAAADHGTARAGSLRYRASQALETHVLRRADAVTTICDGLRQAIIGRGVTPGKISVIPNAVNPEHFRVGAEPDAALARELGLEGRTVLGFIGSFYAYEGLDLLVKALPGLLQGDPDIRLLLVGGGPQEEQLAELARALGVQESVVFTGRVPHGEVQRYYDLVDLFVYPRRSIRLTELVTPLKPLEAMAQGRLVAASDVGGHRELIRAGETGWLFPADDVAGLQGGIGGLLQSRRQWSAMQEAARAFVENERTWAASVARYRPIYAALTGGAAGGGEYA